MTIKEITSKQFKLLLDHCIDESNIGLFFIYSRFNEHFTAIDNSTGDCHIAEFNSLMDCIEWLIIDTDIQDISNELHIEFLYSYFQFFLTMTF